ncbi:MAG: ABC transporter substrate-binding protein [Dehalococcoidales bacterium]|nr:ABC transporter substrate-binding protein [Dehalococcoidales bacterium]
MSIVVNRRLSRRQVLKGLGSASLLAITLGACAPIQSPPPTQAPATQAPAAKPAATQAPPPAGTAAAPVPAPTSQPAAAQPKKGGTLRYGKMGDIRGKDPHPLGADQYCMVNLAWDTPIRFDENLKPQPWLAESWKLSDDNLSLSLNVRKGVKFHTGRDLTAEDFKFNIERVRKPETASQMRFGAEKVKDIVVPDPYTITLKFAEPNPAIWDMLETLYIVDKENVDDEQFKAGIGTGPFKWVEWRPGEKVVFERNADYWVSGQPYVDRLEILFNKDVSAMIISLESGAIDIAEQPADVDLVRLRDGKKFPVVISEFWSDFYYVGAVVTNPPTNNKKVRQAINYAIDRQRFVDTALFGVGEAQAIPWPKNSPAYDAGQAGAYKYDLDKAKQLVQESGASDLRVTIGTSSGISPNWLKLSEILQADLVKIGITAKIDMLERTAWRDKNVNRKFESLWTGQFGFSHMNPSTMCTLAFPWRVGRNTSYFESEDYANLVKAASVAVDPAKAKSIYKDLTRVILDESFMMTVSPQKRTWALAPYVKGFGYGIGNYTWMEKCWLDK